MGDPIHIVDIFDQCAVHTYISRPYRHLRAVSIWLKLVLHCINSDSPNNTEFSKQVQPVASQGSQSLANVRFHERLPITVGNSIEG